MNHAHVFNQKKAQDLPTAISTEEDKPFITFELAEQLIYQEKMSLLHECKKLCYFRGHFIKQEYEVDVHHLASELVFYLAAFEQEAKSSCLGDYLTRLTHCTSVAKLVVDFLGLDDIGIPTGHPRITTSEYTQKIRALPLQSTSSYAAEMLSYALLALALAAPLLAATAVPIGAIITVTSISALASYGLFSMAKKDLGRQCLFPIHQIVHGPDNTLTQLGHRIIN